jgi:hypothetical protein
VHATEIVKMRKKGVIVLFKAVREALDVGDALGAKGRGQQDYSGTS